jgi:hypothetical protein
MQVGDRVLILCKHVPGRSEILIPPDTLATITEIWSGGTITRARLMYDGYVPLSFDHGIYLDGFWFRLEDFCSSLLIAEFSLDEMAEGEAIIDELQGAG